MLCSFPSAAIAFNELERYNIANLPTPEKDPFYPRIENRGMKIAEC